MPRKPAKEEPLPGDLEAMSLDELRALENTRKDREQFHALVQARDKAQAQLEMYVQRDRDIVRAILKRLTDGK